MQPLILLAIVGVAAVALGMGSLTNIIDLDVQDFGVGEETIDSPVDNADVNFHIGQLSGEGVIYNVVDECSISADEDLGPGSLIFCKLTNSIGGIVAEGHKTLTQTLFDGDTITVPITNFAFWNSHNVKNIHDVMVVIQAP